MFYNELFRQQYRYGAIEVETHTVEEDIIDEQEVFIHTIERVLYVGVDPNNQSDFRMVAASFDFMEFIIELDAYDSESGEQIQFTNNLTNLNVLPKE